MEVASSEAEKLERALGRISRPFSVRARAGRLQIEEGPGSEPNRGGDGDPAAFVPACRLENLGDAGFRQDHRLRFACMSGAMANGIGSVEVVEAMGRHGLLGIFGSAGLAVDVIERAIERLERSLGQTIPFGMNLIHSPGEPDMEAATVGLYLKRNVRLIEASAFLNLTLPVVRYRVTGIHRDASGRVVAPNRVIAKVSRFEVASKFMAPPPDRFLQELVKSGEISAEQAECAARIPMAEDITAEADSGGHTDNQPAIVLLPTMLSLRDQLQGEYRYDRPVRIGAAGGISTPWAAAAAFAMGASYIVTGSVNQSCVEAGTSDIVRRMLAQAQQAEIAMAPAADMFEMGVKVQVLKRGTLFAMRAAKLYELYRTYPRLEEIPATERATLEKTVFRAPLETIWEETQAYFQKRDPSRIEKALRDPKQKMALVFRWYLGMSSRWANTGLASRAVDYQIWCGPAMAAFNDWVRGSFLEAPENRRVATVAWNILYGTSVLYRARILGIQGIALPPGLPRLKPLELTEIENRSLSI
ncbi:MAG: PfaD family polyunsaturated fatty acid/polyketide biosynthesis protein [Isosphaeraceae bacterium]